MKKFSVFVLGTATGLALAGVAVAAKTKEATLWAANEIQFAEWTPPKGAPPPPEGTKMPMVANLWGDVNKSAYGAMVKFEAASVHPLHTHTSETKGVVISGNFWFTPEGGEKKTLGPGSYFAIPGGMKHESGADAGTVVFQTGAAKFDMKPVPPPKSAAK
jgi:quercetin dioxygenase-like cupin family protein